jgi:hypothetical protein
VPTYVVCLSTSTMEAWLLKLGQHFAVATESAECSRRSCLLRAETAPLSRTTLLSAPRLLLLPPSKCFTLLCADPEPDFATESSFSPGQAKLSRRRAQLSSPANAGYLIYCRGRPFLKTTPLDWGVSFSPACRRMLASSSVKVSVKTQCSFDCRKTV